MTIPESSKARESVLKQLLEKKKKQQLLRGAWMAQSIGHLPSVQVMIPPGPGIQPLHGIRLPAQCGAFSSLLLLSLSLSLLNNKFVFLPLKIQKKEKEQRKLFVQQCK